MITKPIEIFLAIFAIVTIWPFVLVIGMANYIFGSNYYDEPDANPPDT